MDEVYITRHWPPPGSPSHISTFQNHWINNQKSGFQIDNRFWLNFYRTNLELKTLQRYSFIVISIPTKCSFRFIVIKFSLLFKLHDQLEKNIGISYYYHLNTGNFDVDCTYVRFHTIPLVWTYLKWIAIAICIR